CSPRFLHSGSLPSEGHKGAATGKERISLPLALSSFKQGVQKTHPIDRFGKVGVPSSSRGVRSLPLLTRRRSERTDAQGCVRLSDNGSDTLEPRTERVIWC